MKKAFDQTVRDLKREVNKKVLKVPSIEQKVLDATSNEPWGPHGTLLADIAQATRNYHEYQMIMSVIWKRINDTGKNWRHVYKGLTVLEYLVAHGSERVIDEIREHAYQIQTLSDFQYIDSSGRDQGSNVRKKSQSLVVLVNDKERIQEVRQKAAANRDKFRNTSMGNMYRPGSYSSSGGYGDRYDDDRFVGRYGGREDDRNGYGREREYGYRDDDRYGRYGDPYARDGDRYGREYEDRYSRDDEYRGRSRSIDEYQYGSRSRSSDRDRDRSYEDDGHYSSSSPGRRLDRKYSEQNLAGPPSYEEAVGAARSPTHSERDGETSSASAPKPSSPPASASPPQATSTVAPPPAHASPSPPAPVADNSEADDVDEFDPRGSFSAAPTTSSVAAPPPSGSTEMDLIDSLALVPVTSVTTAAETETSLDSGSGPTYAAAGSASSVSNQAFDDPFGDGPFKAFPSSNGVPGPQQSSIPVSSFQPASNQGPELPQTINSSGAPSSASNVQTPSNIHSLQLATTDPNIDILADILPPTGPQHLVTSQAGYPAPTNQPVPQPGFLPQTGQPASQMAFPSQTGPTAPQTGFAAQPGLAASVTGFPAQSGQPSTQTTFPAQLGQSVSQAGLQSDQPPSLTGFETQVGQASQTAAQIAQPSSLSGFPSQMGPSSQAGFQTLPGGQSAQPTTISYGGYGLQPGSATPMGQHMASQVFTGPVAQQSATNNLARSSSGVPVASQMALPAAQLGSNAFAASQSASLASTGSLAMASQPAKDKFETKSTVWADTLSRGLVNLNISGSKINPLSDIGIDFDALNRKEKRMEKPSVTPVVSTVTMGKAMGSGSGIGRAGAGAIRPPPNPMMGAGMGMGMAGGPRPGIGMGSYAGMNQPLGVGMGMNMQANMGMGMNMSMGGQMQQPTGFRPGSAIPGGYNPMMGAGNYGQQPYGGGYRSV